MRGLIVFILLSMGALVIINAFAPNFDHHTLGYLGPFRVSGALALAGLTALILRKK